MRVNKKEEKLLEQAIDQWQKDELIDSSTGQRLKSSISSYRGEFDTVAFYASIAAVSCAILAFGALVMDEKWIERLRKFFAFSEMIIGFAFAAISFILIWVAKRRTKKYAYANLANESFTILIALSIGVTVAYLCRGVAITFPYYGWAVFITAVLYGITAFYLHSKLLWLCMLIALLSSWGTLTYAWSADVGKSYFLGMNYPLRMTVLGVVLVIIAYILRNKTWFKNWYTITWYSCWTFLLTSALFFSVSGNWNYEVWAAIKQGKLFMWAVAYTVFLTALLVYAYRSKDDLLRDMVIVFFLVNLYTRYFEYFWDITNKGIFFAVLALSFWLIGRKAEKMRKKLSDT